MRATRFTIDGVSFECLGRWRYVVVYRYPGASRAHIAPWEGFTSFGTMPAAKRAFTVTIERHRGAYVYLADLRANTFLGAYTPAGYGGDRITDEERSPR